MKTLFCFFLAMVLAVSLCSQAISRDIPGIEDKTDLLSSELPLAKKPIIYFIFDLEKKEVLLKSRGIVLKKMKIEDVKFWGDIVDAKPQIMLRKSALFKEPKRVTIDPNKAKEEEAGTNTTANKTPGTFEIDALELQDMPTTYHLEFSKGIYISVRPKSSGFVSNLYAIANYAGWYMSRPVLTIWHSIKGSPYISIYLTMSEEDARSIYWSLVENSENIIYKP
jgi:hypothetical protein